MYSQSCDWLTNRIIGYNIYINHVYTSNVSEMKCVVYAYIQEDVKSKLIYGKTYPHLIIYNKDLVNNKTVTIMNYLW